MHVGLCICVAIPRYDLATRLVLDRADQGITLVEPTLEDVYFAAIGGRLPAAAVAAPVADGSVEVPVRPYDGGDLGNDVVVHGSILVRRSRSINALRSSVAGTGR